MTREENSTTVSPARVSPNASRCARAYARSFNSPGKAIVTVRTTEFRYFFPEIRKSLKMNAMLFRPAGIRFRFPSAAVASTRS